MVASLRKPPGPRSGGSRLMDLRRAILGVAVIFATADEEYLLKCPQEWRGHGTSWDVT